MLAMPLTSIITSAIEIHKSMEAQIYYWVSIFFLDVKFNKIVDSSV